MNVLLLTSHSIAEYDDLRMLTDLGYDVYSIGGAYSEVPFEGKRPPLDVPRYPELEAATEAQRARMEQEHGSPDQRPQGGHHNIDWGKARLAPEVIDWADVIIVHHFPEQWIIGQWDAIRSKRVIWRTCGQSDPRLESVMEPFHADGMQIVRYSPKEEEAFTQQGMWAGQDAVIRFGKYPADYGPYDGAIAAIGNVTQDMAQRGEICGLDRWNRITAGLAVNPAGPGSEALRGGFGSLSYTDMLSYLRHIRAYLYLGTQPASYTLGLMEAMLSGVPVLPIRWEVPDLDWRWLGDLWEANDIVAGSPATMAARGFLEALLRDKDFAIMRGEEHRQRAIELFDVATVGPQWKAFLG